MLFDISNAGIEELQDDLFVEKQVSVFVLRLDKIHPLVSGNKIFKLHYFLQEAIRSTHSKESTGKTIVTFGGAHSNHLAATAFACKALHLKSVGIVRGERPAVIPPTLQQCIQDGMQLKFISRQQYTEKETPAFLDQLHTEFINSLIIPEGGYHPLGAKGAALIFELIKDNHYTHICTASGTATTLAGLLMAAKAEQTVISVPVLKGITDTAARLKMLTGNQPEFKNLEIFDGYHFGGYAKKNAALTAFMNDCWLKYGLPLDFVYTAKMLYAIIDRIKKNAFARGSKIICIHTGGLQGNKSLPLNTLLF